MAGLVFSNRTMNVIDCLPSLWALSQTFLLSAVNLLVGPVVQRGIYLKPTATLHWHLQCVWCTVHVYLFIQFKRLMPKAHDKRKIISSLICLMVAQRLLLEFVCFRCFLLCINQVKNEIVLTCIEFTTH